MFSPERFVPAKSVFLPRVLVFAGVGFARAGGAPLNFWRLIFRAQKQRWLTESMPTET